jgi:hypothetical protein
VRAYHNQRAISSKAYVARRHLAMPASQASNQGGRRKGSLNKVTRQQRAEMIASGLTPLD